MSKECIRSPEMIKRENIQDARSNILKSEKLLKESWILLQEIDDPRLKDEVKNAIRILGGIEGDLHMKLE